MLDAQRGEILADQCHHHLDGFGAHDRQPLRFRRAAQRISVLRGERSADRLEVVARIKPFRDHADGLAQRLAVAQIGRAREHVDLGAGVVDVILARDGKAGEREQVRQSIAKHGPAAMADMQRSGRIGRNVLDVDRRTRPDIARTVADPEPHRAAQRLDPGSGLERQIDKTRPGHLDLVDEFVGAQSFGNPFGKLARLFAGFLGEHHGGVGRHIAVRGFARRLDGHPRLIDASRQVAGRDQGHIGATHAVENFSEDVLCGH